MTKAISMSREEILPAWRAAELAYRANMRVTRHNDPAWVAAYAAFRKVLPEMPKDQAKSETTHAIAWAATNHTKWFWDGMYGASIEVSESTNPAGSDR
jgi:hypothetical protein